MHRIKKIINGNIDSIVLAAALVAFFSLVSRLLGVFRDRILAGEFGAGDTLDVYYAAFRIPDLIFNLLVLGALSAGFIPVFTALIKQAKKEAITSEDNQEAWLLVNNIINLLIIGLIVLCTVGIIFAPWLMRIITPGFSQEKMDLTVSLTRIMFLSPIFLGLSSVLAGVLQSFRNFFIYSLAPIFYNIGIIIGALFLVPRYGIYGLAFGVILGALMHLAVQLPSVFSYGFRYRWTFDWKEFHVRRIFRMMIPRTMSLAIAQIDLIISTAIASTLMSGSLAIFNFANNLQAFPIGIFGISFATAAFPTLSAQVKNNEKFVENFSSTVRKILFFIIPATILFVTLRAQIIRVVLGSGKFDWEDTVLTMSTLGYFSISLFAQAIIPLLVRMFYARGDSRRPFYIGLVSVATDIILGWTLSRFMGVAGIALGFSVANIVNFVLLWAVLRRQIGNMDELKILFSTVKFILASAACGLAVQLSKLAVWPFVDMNKFSGVIIQGAAAGLAGITAYIFFSWLLRSEEFFSFYNSFRRRINWGKVKTDDSSEARGI